MDKPDAVREKADVLCCMDCPKPYSEFGLDLHVPRAQWLAINPNEGGVLCAQCIVNRLAKLPGVTVVHAIAEISPHYRQSCINEGLRMAAEVCNDNNKLLMASILSLIPDKPKEG